MTLLDWNVAVYCLNEAARLRQCLASLSAALAGSRAVITVILNGSTDGSLAIALDMAGKVGAGEAEIQVFQIDAADKSNAINQFYQTLRLPARLYGEVDGYAVVAPSTFRAMQARLARDAHAVGVSGVAANGRTSVRDSARMIAEGGVLMGQLHALRGEFLDAMVARGIRLPINLYRGDGLLTGMAAYNLEPRPGCWDNARIPAEAGASFEIQPLSVLRAADWKRQLNRKVRQMRGRIEAAAIKTIVYKHGYAALPADANDMLRSYLADNGVPPVSAIDRPFMMAALRQLGRATRPAPEALTARPVNAPKRD